MEFVTLDTNDIERLDVPALNRTKTQKCIQLHGRCNSNDLDKLVEVKNLTKLVFIGFGDSVFPVWVYDCKQLESLCFRVGRLVASEADPDLFVEEAPDLPDLPKLPSSVRCLELYCDVAHTVMDSLLTHGSRLTELSIKTHCISDKLKIERCCDLKILKLDALKDFDGDILKKCPIHLETLHLSGCLDLNADHLSLLVTFQNLKQLCISNSFLSCDACEALASLENRCKLKFELCTGIAVRPFLQREDTGTGGCSIVF